VNIQEVRKQEIINPKNKMN